MAPNVLGYIQPSIQVKALHDLSILLPTYLKNDQPCCWVSPDSPLLCHVSILFLLVYSLNTFLSLKLQLKCS